MPPITVCAPVVYMSTPTTPGWLTDESVGAEIRTYVAQCRLSEIVDKNLRNDYAELLTAAGYRVVDGGQTFDDYWEITDARTGEVLLRGQGDAYDVAVDPSWVHVDNMYDWVKRARSRPHEPVQVGSALPIHLQDALFEWVVQYPEEVDMLLHSQE